VALASGRNPMLHAHLVHSVHPVRFAPGRIEIRVLPAAPRDLAAQLGALLQEVSGTRWTIALSNAEGEPTLAEQGRAAEAGRRAVAQSHPLVQALLAAFPGASIEAVRDANADAYGLGGAMPAPAQAEDQPESEPGDVPPTELEEPADFDDVPPPDDER
jgi:DNA polymerase III subunit gamma/tau